LENILHHYNTQAWIGCQIQVHREYQKRFPKRGRPKGSQTGQVSWKPYFSICFSVDRQALDQESLSDGVFPLITNLESDNYNAKQVLEIYKFQGFIEKRHSQLKTWQEVTPVLLKKDERVVGYLHMHVMALTVATLIERQLRKAMRQRSIPWLPLYPEDRRCPYPTMFDIVRVFRGVERYEVLDGEKVTLFPAALNPLQHQLLELLEVPKSLYQ
jgi:transposase